MSLATARIKAIVAEFATPADLIHAAEKVRDAGFSRFDCHSPFPIHGMDKAMGLRRSPLGFIIGTMALLTFGGFAAFLYWATVTDYPHVISGKPIWSFQAYAPPIFAITVLASAITATFGMFVLNRLPQLFHPLFESENFRRFSDDAFFVSIDASDPKFDLPSIQEFLKRIGGQKIETIEVKE